MGQEEICISSKGRIGRIHLNRPRALNSLTLAMVRAFKSALQEFAANPAIMAVLLSGEGDRGLCAGGDIRTLYELRDKDKNYYRNFWREEYELNALIARYPKPYIALMDGLVMGGGVGISAHGICRVVTERTSLAMPETGIGFIPDVGGTWLLSRSGGLGLYMALSGATVRGEDAIAAGLADWLIDSVRLTELVDRLESLESAAAIEKLLLALRRKPDIGSGTLDRKLLDHAMAGSTINEILERLSSSASSLGQAAVLEICSKSPTSLKVTLALLRRGAKSARLEECLIAEFRAACRLLESHDLYEGIRAAVVDKDRSPKWLPATLAEVSDAAVAEILGGDGTPEPAFPECA